MSEIHKFLAALEASRRGASFPCPATGMEVTLSAPSVVELRAARHAVQDAWEDRIVTQLTGGQMLDDLDVELLSRVTKVDGFPLGKDAIEALDEQTFEVYTDALDKLREDSGGSMTDQQMSAAIDELKKKHEKIAVTLSGLESSTLRALLAYTVGQLSDLQT